MKRNGTALAYYSDFLSTEHELAHRKKMISLHHTGRSYGYNHGSDYEIGRYLSTDDNGFNPSPLSTGNPHSLFSGVVELT